MRVALISLEPWDEVWRRNQHIASQLVAQGHVLEFLFIEPPVLSTAPGASRVVAPGITVVRASLRLPKRAGGLAMAGALLKGLTSRADVLWINDAVLGVHCLVPGQPALYDVTDDWRAAGTEGRARRRLVRAEDRLAHRTRTVVCSDDLRGRWLERYGVEAAVVPNGVDLRAMAAARPQRLDGSGPHIAYVGTIHAERLDLPLLSVLSHSSAVGTVHLVGPVALTSEELRFVEDLPRVRVHGPVKASQVPSWMKAMDVLVCPHLVTEFTRSLDAIKAHEYLASGRPVIATPTSGFENLHAEGVHVVDRDDFVAALAGLGSGTPDLGTRGATDWAERAHEFARQLTAARAPGKQR